MSKNIQDANGKKKDDTNEDQNTGNGPDGSSTGGDDDDDKGDKSGSGSGDGANTGDDPDNSNDNDGDKDLGFPKDTPVVEMSEKEQAAYWKHKARKHEDSAKDLKKVLGDLTVDDIASLTETKTKYDTLLASSSQSESDHAQALEDAKKAGAAEERAKFAPTLLDLEIRALLGDRYEENKLKTILSRTNTDGFFTDEGTVDAASVKEYFDVLFVAAPAGSTKTTRTTHGGHGAGDGAPATGSAGKALYEEMKKKNRR